MHCALYASAAVFGQRIHLSVVGGSCSLWRLFMAHERRPVKLLATAIHAGMNSLPVQSEPRVHHAQNPTQVYVLVAGPSLWGVCVASRQCAGEGNAGEAGWVAAGWHGAVRCMGTTCLPAQVCSLQCMAKLGIQACCAWSGTGHHLHEQ